MRDTLAQLAPGAAAETLLYECPKQTQSDTTSLIVCNRSAVAASFRVSVSLGGSATTTKDYHYYDMPIDANDTFVASLGLTLRAGDIVRVYASTANLSFNLLGEETSPAQNRR